jgi:two-component system, cell cycle response regulator
MKQKAPICLYADDHATFRALMGHYMASFGYDLTLAKDGDEAFMLSLIRPYDLIFLDHEMPFMTGLEVGFHYKRCVTDKGQVPAPIILVTGRDKSFCEENLAKGHIDFYLSKPFSAKDLILVIDHVLTQVRASPRG